jgi:protein-ribulosamine 3-kinase
MRNEQGRIMTQGECASMSELAKYFPDLVPTPYAQGLLQDASEPTYFFLMEFLDIHTGVFDPVVLCRRLALLHQSSTSPNGKFGFAITTTHGPNPQDVTWEASWSIFLARLLRQFFNREIAVNGPTEDGLYEAAFEELITFVVPALLNPLQAEGRTLTPALVHGDLWEENCGTDNNTGELKIFDAACFYGHNEYDLGMWRRDIVKIDRTCIQQYFEIVSPSEPVVQWDDRNRLYSMKFEIAHAIGWPASVASRREM